jgi:dihydrofolate synthase/folylpolyglutamate synthase
MYNNERYQQSVQRLQSVIRRPGTGGTDYMKPHLDRSFFIERTRDFVERCRIPYNDLEIIHVAGTSGKGSTSSMIANVLHAAGQHVGLFRSPFVTTSIENIEVDGLLISPDDFSDLVDWVMPFVDAAGADDPEMAPSYGEIFFAIAMKHFVNIGCEWVVLETGCGGRFDYTNIIENPRICVLTR